MKPSFMWRCHHYEVWYSPRWSNSRWVEDYAISFVVGSRDYDAPQVSAPCAWLRSNCCVRFNPVSSRSPSQCEHVHSSEVFFFMMSRPSRYTKFLAVKSNILITSTVFVLHCDSWAYQLKLYCTTSDTTAVDRTQAPQRRQKIKPIPDTDRGVFSFLA